MGDYQSIVAMPIRAPFPAIGKEVVINGFDLAAPTEVWTLQSMDEIPNVLLHFDHQVRRLEIEVVDAATGARCTPCSRTCTSRTTCRGTRPRPGSSRTRGTATGSTRTGRARRRAWPGRRSGRQYKLVVHALKALGDPANPAHWENWTSPTITIDRP